MTAHDLTAQDRSIFKPAVMLMSGRAAGFIVTFFVPVVLARVFTQEEFGTYKQLFLIAYTLFPFVQLGFAECLFYFIPGRPECSPKFVTNSILMLAVAGTVCAAALIMYEQAIAAWMNNPAIVDYMPIIGVYLVLIMMSTVLEITMLTRKRYAWATGTYAASDVLRSLLLIIPAFLTRSLEWALIGGILFCVTRLIAAAAYLRAEYGTELGLDRGLLREQVIYSVPYSLAVLVEMIQSNYHHFAVSNHFDVATFAIYSVGCLQIPLVDFMATPVANVMMVRMAEELREKRMAEAIGIWHEGSRKLALVFFPLVGLLMVNAGSLIPLLFTDAFRAAVPIFMVWSLSFACSSFQTTAVLRVFNETRFIFLTNLARLVAIAALMSWFLATFHLVGAALVTLIGILVAKIMALIKMRSLMQTGWPGILPWRGLGGILLVAMLASVPPLVLQMKLNLPDLYLLPISGLLYMMAYTPMVLSFGLLSPAEKQALLRYVWNSRNYLFRRAASGS